LSFLTIFDKQFKTHKNGKTQVGMESFCNSLSKIIQHVHSEQDVTNIIESIHKMEEDDAFQMDKVF
jgi:hypothetical protein